MLSTWTLLLFLIYNPGDGGMPVFHTDKVEFPGGKESCERGRRRALAAMGDQFRGAGAVCVDRSVTSEPGLNTWTAVTFFAYNPGNGVTPFAEKHRIEFFTPIQCENGALGIRAALAKIPGVVRVASVCFGREPDLSPEPKKG